MPNPGHVEALTDLISDEINGWLDNPQDPRRNGSTGARAGRPPVTRVSGLAQTSLAHRPHPLPAEITGQPQPVVAVKLDFGQQVAQRDTNKGTRRKGQDGGQPQVRGEKRRGTKIK